MTATSGDSALYETCHLDGNPYPCEVHVGCYAAGFDSCQDVRTERSEDEHGRTTTTRCHLCGNFFGELYEPLGWYQWADVRVGQTWRSRDKRDDGLTVTVLGFTQDRVEILRYRRSFVRKDRWHREYAPVNSETSPT